MTTAGDVPGPAPAPPSGRGPDPGSAAEPSPGDANWASEQHRCRDVERSVPSLGARELPGDYFRRSAGCLCTQGLPLGISTGLTIEVKFGEAVPANDRTKTNSAAHAALVSVPGHTVPAVRHAR